MGLVQGIDCYDVEEYAFVANCQSPSVKRSMDDHLHYVRTSLLMWAEPFKRQAFVKVLSEPV